MYFYWSIISIDITTDWLIKEKNSACFLSSINSLLFASLSLSLCSISLSRKHSLEYNRRTSHLEKNSFLPMFDLTHPSIDGSGAFSSYPIPYPPLPSSNFFLNIPTTLDEHQNYRSEFSSTTPSDLL